MTVHYDNAISYFNNNEEFISDYKQFVEHPDHCPVCKVGVSPEYILIYSKTNGTSEVLCGCPRNECRSLFIVEYKIDGSTLKAYQDFLISRYYPTSKEKEIFPDVILDLSPSFNEIYQQALHAESEGLNLVCGPGYRKALEFLVKDFAIKRNPDSEEDIKRTFLKGCLTTYIENPAVVGLAERAAWLGNDESHYERKWPEKDVQDLKQLITLIVRYVETDLLTQKIIEEDMPEGR